MAESSSQCQTTHEWSTRSLKARGFKLTEFIDAKVAGGDPSGTTRPHRLTPTGVTSGLQDRPELWTWRALRGDDLGQSRYSRIVTISIWSRVALEKHKDE
jgi:hypothetical protein